LDAALHLLAYFPEKSLINRKLMGPSGGKLMIKAGREAVESYHHFKALGRFRD
jgi:hypothetical protein